MASREDIAWAAGLFEGEGSMSVRGNLGVSLFLGMTDEDVVARFATIVGAGRVYVKQRPKQEWKDIYAWHCNKSEDVRRILSEFMPHMGLRRKDRAVEMLERLARNQGARATWTHCPYGHPLSGDNLYTHPKRGTRMCKACAAERQRRRVTAQREAVS